MLDNASTSRITNLSQKHIASSTCQCVTYHKYCLLAAGCLPVHLQVMEVEVGRPGRLVPPPERQAAGGKQGKGKGAKAARK